MNKEQKELLAEKVMDAGNLAIAALTFGSLLSQFNLIIVFLGLTIFVLTYLYGIGLRRGQPNG